MAKKSLRFSDNVAYTLLRRTPSYVRHDIALVHEEARQMLVGRTVGQAIMDSVNNRSASTEFADEINYADSRQTKKLLERFRKIAKIDGYVANEACFWPEFFLDFLLPHWEAPIATAIRNALSKLPSPVDIDMNVIALLKIANPTFGFRCKNVCNDAEIRQKFPNVRDECTSMENTLSSVTGNASAFDKHVFFAFRCGLLATKYTVRR